MNNELLSHLGPAPFKFTPTQPGGRSGPAFSRPFQLLATLLVGACAAWLVSLWRAGALGNGGSSGLVWFLCGLGLMFTTWWFILSSKTRLDETALHQSWVWDKKLELRELAYCKLIRVRWLDWLIAPRLYARTLLGKFAVFYAADPVLLADFERLVRELAAFRKME